MYPGQLIPDEPDPERQPARDEAAAASPADQIQIRHLERACGWTRYERLRVRWYRLRLAIQEMNYAARRLTELRTRVR